MPVSIEELYQLLGFKDVLLNVAQARVAVLEQQVAELQAALEAAPKPRIRKAA